MSIFDWFKKPRKTDHGWSLASPDQFIEAWKRTFGNYEKSWVLFRHGTCVILADAGADADLKDLAIVLMQEYGPVYPASPAGDFGTLSSPDYAGWAVSGHHKDILTYVAPSEVPRGHDTDLEIGIYGRMKRDSDAKGLEVIYIEDRRNQSNG